MMLSQSHLTIFFAYSLLSAPGSDAVVTGKPSNVFNVSTSDLDAAIADGYKAITSPTNFPNGTWALSKYVYYESSDLVAPNLTIYGSSVFQEGATVEDGTTFTFAATEAYFNETLCASSYACGGYSVEFDMPWFIGQSDGGNVFWDCSNIVEDRLCTGTNVLIERNDVFDPDYFESGDTCYYEEGAFQGESTCFVPLPSASPSLPGVPTASPTVTPTVTASPSLDGSGAFGKVVGHYCTIFAIVVVVANVVY